MPTSERTPDVVISESGNGPYGQIVTAGHHVQGADEPETLGGHDTGLSPYQYLLAALGSCTAMTLRIYADQHEYKLEHISVSLTHRRVPAPDGRGTRDQFARTITLTGALDDAQRQRLLDIAGRCPVSQTLGRGSEVTAVLV
jgi:putative redox protein